MKKISFGIILILLVSLFGVTLYYNQQVSELNQTLDSLGDSLEDKHELENEYSEVKTELNNLELDYEKLKNDYDDLLANYSDTRLNYEEAQVKLDKIQEDLEQVQERNEELEQSLSDLRDGTTFYRPKLSSVESFLEANEVDENEYKEDEYTCVDYTFDLMKAGEKKGFETGFVYIYLYDESSTSAHSIAYFNTSDEGIIYVEPQTDTIMHNLPLNEYYWKVVYDTEGTEYDGDFKYRISQYKISP